MLLAASLQRAQRGSVAGSGAGKAARPRSKTSAPNSSVHQVWRRIASGKTFLSLVLQSSSMTCAPPWRVAMLLEIYCGNPVGKLWFCNAGIHQLHRSKDTSLALIGSLPSLIRKYQTQGAVVAPLCHAVRLLQLELFALRNEERAYGDLLNLVSDQVFRHADYQVATQAVDTLVFCSKAGPGSLQPIARLALSSVVAKASQGLGAAARAVLKLSDRALQAEVEELESAGRFQGWVVGKLQGVGERGHSWKLCKRRVQDEGLGHGGVKVEEPVGVEGDNVLPVGLLIAIIENAFGLAIVPLLNPSVCC
eukprot:scaffold88892_cov22-Tisochrysis_lutea.AAC.1